jgi:hypothetical protein
MITRDDTRPDPMLLVTSAFVVQFRKDTAVSAAGMRGHVAQIVSGETAAFHSLEELRAFLARVLRAERARSQGAGPEDEP